MKVAVIGATGFVGANIAGELAARGIRVTGISRSKRESSDKNIHYVAVNVMDAGQLAEVLKGHDAVVSAYNPGWENPNIYDDFLAGSKAIQEAVKQSGVDRYIIIGGAGSLYVAPGVQAVDTDTFPKEIYNAAAAARDYLNILKEEKDLDWAFFSPAFEMHQGITTGRTGKYRLGTDYPVFDNEQRSILSGEDLAVVIADEIEAPKHHRVRFTAGY